MRADALFLAVILPCSLCLAAGTGDGSSGCSFVVSTPYWPTDVADVAVLERAAAAEVTATVGYTVGAVTATSLPEGVIEFAFDEPRNEALATAACSATGELAQAIDAGGVVLAYTDGSGAAQALRVAPCSLTAPGADRQAQDDAGICSVGAALLSASAASADGTGSDDSTIIGAGTIVGLVFGTVAIMGLVGLIAVRLVVNEGRVFKPSSKTKLSSYEEGEFDRMGGGFMVENQMMANSAF